MYIASNPSGLPPCVDCARAIIQCGIVRLVYVRADVPERWRESCDVALEMLKEAGVEVVIMEAGVE
jgi:dCMP deaminase